MANPYQVFELTLFSGLLMGAAAADTKPLKQQTEKHGAPAFSLSYSPIFGQFPG